MYFDQPICLLDEGGINDRAVDQRAPTAKHEIGLGRQSSGFVDQECAVNQQVAGIGLADEIVEIGRDVALHAVVGIELFGARVDLDVTVDERDLPRSRKIV